MGFIQGVTAGAAIRDRDRDLYRPTNAALSYGAITDAPRAMGGKNVLSSEPAADLGGMNPAAIHRQAAELVLQEKEMDLQKTALEVERIKAARDLINDQRGAIARTKEKEAEDWTFNRQKQIDEEYQRGMGRVKDWQGAQDRQAAAQKDTQRQAYKQAMAGLFMGNGEAMKQYINQFGDPNTNVENVMPDPSGSGGIVIQPAPKDGQKQKALFFRDPEAFFRGFGFFMHPDSPAMIQQGTKGEQAETAVSPKDVADIRHKAAIRYLEKKNLGPGQELTAEEEKEMAAVMDAEEKLAIEHSRTGKRVGPAIVSGKPMADGVGAKSVVQKGQNPKDVPGARLSPKDRNYYIPDKERPGKWVLLEPEGESLATDVSETPAYGKRMKGKMPERPSPKSDKEVKAELKNQGKESVIYTDETGTRMIATIENGKVVKKPYKETLT